MNLIGVTSRSMGEVTGTEMTRRQLYHPHPHHPVSISSQKLETWDTVHNLQAAQQAGEQSFPAAQQPMPLLGISAGLTAYICLGREEPSESDQFQELPEATELFTSWV